MREITSDDLLQVAKIFVIACIQTNAEELTLKQEQFHDDKGNQHGDWVIKVKKIKRK